MIQASVPPLPCRLVVQRLLSALDTPYRSSRRSLKAWVGIGVRVSRQAGVVLLRDPESLAHLRARRRLLSDARGLRRVRDVRLWEEGL